MPVRHTYLWDLTDAGKTTLGLTIMGNPRYNVINGSIVLDG